MARPQAWLGDPWHPTAIAQVPPGSGGTVNALAFRPPSQGLAVMISAVKFQIQPTVAGTLTGALLTPGFSYYGSPSTSGINGAGYQLGHAVSVSFALAKYNAAVQGGDDPTSGNVPAIGAFAGRVPIGTLCDSRNLGSDMLAGGYTLGGAPFTAVNPISEYRYELAEPMYVPNGYIFLPQFFGLGGNLIGRAGTLAATTQLPVPSLQVQVSYEATLLDPSRYGDEGDYTDEVTRLPFAAAYLGSLVPGASDISTYNDQSDETELTNIYDEPACLTQITGKLVAASVLNDAVVDLGGALMIRMLAGNHHPLVRDYAAWRTVFDRQTRAWDLSSLNAGYTLDAGESIIAFVTGGQDQTAKVNLANPGALIQPVIVTSGYREVSLSALG